MVKNQEFEQRKEAAYNAAQEQGIVDVVTASDSDGSISIETVELATELMKEYGDGIYNDLEIRRRGRGVEKK
jgi:hypothetical protein